MSSPNSLPRRLLLAVALVEGLFGLAVVLVMAFTMRDQPHDPDVWSVMYVGLAFLSAALIGILLAVRARSPKVVGAAVILLAGLALAYTGALLVRPV